MFRRKKKRDPMALEFEDWYRVCMIEDNVTGSFNQIYFGVFDHEVFTIVSKQKADEKKKTG